MHLSRGEEGGCAGEHSQRMDFTPVSRACDASPQLSRRINPLSTPFIIGIAGGTASGKTTVCKCITERLGGQRVVLLSLDEFYRDLTAEEVEHIAEVNFDEPGAFDIPSLLKCLDDLRSSEPTHVPVYDFCTSRRSSSKSRWVNAADVVIIEGILVLHFKEILNRCHMKIFVDTDDDIRLARRIKRDTVERGRCVEGVLDQYTRFVKPSFDKFILPSKASADIIIPWREDKPVAVDLITQHVRMKLEQNSLGRVYNNFEVMSSSMQTRGMHTFIRDRTTSREDFVFYADRLNRLAIEHALAVMPFNEKTVETPTGAPYAGLEWKVKLCGVSVIRSGEAMENALRACCAGIPIGKVLIHSSGNSKECLYRKLPGDIAKRHVLLMDPVMSSGDTASAAINVLVEAGVEEDRIVVLSLIASPEAVHKVCTKYKRLRVITSEIDQGVDAQNLVTPGVGDFGDRYFGTISKPDEESVAVQRPLTNGSSHQVSNGA